MPHYRTRILEEVVRKAVGWAPIVGVTGARQTGKTTLLKRFGNSFASFDDPKLEERFRAGGVLALEGSKKPFFLDEVQKYPPVFDLLKLAVEENRAPGQFLITGSVRFSSKKGIRESLTGRGQFWEILPLTIQECHGVKYDDLLALLLHPSRSLEAKLKLLERRLWCQDSQISGYLEKGGMPGICFLRDAVQRTQALDSYLETSLARDLPMLHPSKLRFAQTLEIFREVLRFPGDPVNLSLLARRHSVSAPTIKGLLGALESLYLLRRHGKGYFPEDLAFVSGNDTRRFVFGLARSWVAYMKEHQATLSEYASRGGSHVPFVIRTRSGRTLAITTDDEVSPSEKSLKSLQSLLKVESGAVLICVHRGDRAFIHKDKILALPWNYLC